MPRLSENEKVDGRRARYRFVVGYLYWQRSNGLLTLVADNNLEVVNLHAHNVEILDG